MTKTRVEAFREWLDTARTGQVFIYYTGFLSVDRGSYVDYADGHPVTFEPSGDIDTLGEMAFAEFKNGRVHLFQRKIHDNEYQYIAMKRRDGGRIW